MAPHWSEYQVFNQELLTSVARNLLAKPNLDHENIL